MQLLFRNELDRADEKTRLELGRVEKELNAYASVGDELDVIVREYEFLTEEIESKKWALNELKGALRST